MKLIIDIPEEDYIRLRDEGMFGNVTTFKRAVREGIPLAEQEPCEDSIVEWKKDFKGYVDSLSMPRDDYNGIMEYIDELPVTPQPCTDAISRQAVLDLIEHYNSDGLGSVFYGYEQGVKFADAVNKLPPVTPQYTEAEIQKMQDLEFAEIQKAYEIGKDEGSEVLDKIRAEMEQIKEAEYQIYGKGSWRFVDKCLEIIDKYKASPTGAESEGME